MVTRFWARNLGVFRECSVPLGSLTVFVGKNASGKTTILRGIRTLAMLTRIPLYSNPRRPLMLARTATVEDLFGDQDSSLELGVDARSDHGAGSYSIVIGRNPINGLLEIAGERAKWLSGNGDSWEFDANEDVLKFQFRGTTLSSELPRSASLSHLAFPYFREDKDWGRKLKPLYELTSACAPFHVYRLSPSAIAAPADPTDSFSYDGAGLAAELDRLLGTDRARFGAIVDDLRELFPHIEDVNIITSTYQSRGEQRAQKALQFKVRGGSTIPADMESDGVILSLAYLWLTHISRTSFGVEEPENGAYTSLVGARVNALQGLAERGVQVLITTQSPVLLMQLADPAQVRVFWNDPGSGEPGIFQPPEVSMMDVIYRYLEWSL